jgi:hypothetical protein
MTAFLRKAEIGKKISNIDFPDFGMICLIDLQTFVTSRSG